MTDSLFHVFIERARSSAPGAGAELARAIAARYGIPAAELEKRFAAGRFRVKGNVDRATAESYAADLASMGAVCSVVSASAPPPAAAQAMTLPSAHRVAAAAVAAPVAPPPSAVQDLGALTGEMPLTLSTIDGASEDEARASRNTPLPGSFGPADGGRSSAHDMLAASFGPPVESTDPGRTSKSTGLPASFGPPAEVDHARSSSRKIATAGAADVAPIETFDPFAPPEMQSDEPELTLAVERKPRQSKAPSVAPPARVEVPPPPTARHTMADDPAPRERRETRSRAVARPAGGSLGFLRDEGTRFIAGVVLATLLGGVPALLIGSARERSAFAQLNSDLEKRQDEASKRRETWDGLDRVRASFVERKRSERQTIAITSVLIWVVLSGGLAWLWFRKIDWDRLDR
ncbi:MAG: hypothetical protein IPL61_30000 [Myxococcales bacterium]|nr:hypothetical protein [Myxococcales bacterium]